MMSKKIVILDILFEGHFEGNTKNCGACSNGVTICPEMNVKTCPDTVSLIKYEIA